MVLGSPLLPSQGTIEETNCCTVVLACSLTSPLLVVFGLPFLRDGALALGRDACGTSDENDSDAEDRKRLLADEI